MRIKTSRISLVLMVLFIARGATTLEAQSLKPVKITPEWNAKIAKLMPARPRVKPAATRRVLLFSLTTGFKHWAIPHIDRVIELLAEKTGAFEVTRSTDVAVFEREALTRFDAVILNNNCSKGPGRNLFIDVLGDDRSRAARLEKNIRDFVAEGKGLTAIHGAIVCFNNSPEFSDMLGGSFDFHPCCFSQHSGLLERTSVNPGEISGRASWDTSCISTNVLSVWFRFFVPFCRSTRVTGRLAGSA